MRVMLIWPSPAPEVEILLCALEKAGHEVVYWVGEHPVAHLSPAETVFHDHYDAWDAKPAQVFSSEKILPPSAELIKSMYATEALVLSMMNKHYDTSPVDERKHIYYTMLGYWNHVLDVSRPDVVVFNLIPHSIYTSVIYDLARNRGIPTMCFEETWIAGRLIMHRDFWKGSDLLRNSLKETMAKDIHVEDLHPELQTYYLNQKDPQANKVPWYMQEQTSKFTGVGLLKHRLRILLSYPRLALPRAVALFARFFQPNLRTEYQRYVKKADFAKPYVYFPLNFQPERTTSPQGDMYHDQILAVETLSAALPEGLEIYVKEHPSQWWMRTKTRYSSSRYVGYYERLARIPRTRLVPTSTNSLKLIEGSHAVATITGTAGWEALLSGKNVLVFGIPWYRDCPGIFSVRSVEDCKGALGKMSERKMLDEKYILAFLKALEYTSTRAHIGSSGNVLPTISEAESMRAVASTVVSELDLLKKSAG